MFLRAEQLNVSELKNRNLVFKIKRKELNQKITVRIKSARGCSWVQQPVSSLTSFTIKEVIKKVRFELVLKGGQRVTLT